MIAKNTTGRLSVAGQLPGETTSETLCWDHLLVPMVYGSSLDTLEFLGNASASPSSRYRKHADAFDDASLRDGSRNTTVLAEVQEMPEEMNGADAADFFSSLNDFWQRMAAAGTSNGTDAATTSGPEAGSKNPTPDYGQMMDIMAKASFAFMNGSSRYWKRWSETYGNYYPAISRGLAAMAG